MLGMALMAVAARASFYYGFVPCLSTPDHCTAWHQSGWSEQCTPGAWFASAKDVPMDGVFKAPVWLFVTS